jgi:hypothetical protein
MMHDKELLEDYRKRSLHYLVSHFLLSAMEHSFQSIIEKQRVKVDRDVDLLKLILNYMKKRIDDFEEYPIVQIFFYIGLCFFESENEKYYFRLEEIFKTNYDKIETLDKRNIFLMMQTYCQKKITEGKTEYYSNLIKILSEMLENNIETYSKSEYLRLNFCRNFIVVAARTNEAKALESFIAGHIQKVDPENRESIKDFAYANLYFIQKRFSKALEYCNKTQFNELFMSTNDNLYFKNDVKRISLICYYELGYYENALTQIDSYKHFLNNSKLIRDDMRESTHHFLNLTGKLINLKFSFDEYDLEKLLKEILNSKILGNRDWLLEKVNQLRKKL